MPDTSDATHYVGDNCPGGHYGDPYRASKLNDELLDDALIGVPVAGTVARLGDRQAALFAAIHFGIAPQRREPPPIEVVLDLADQLLAWLEERDADA